MRLQPIVPAVLAAFTVLSPAAAESVNEAAPLMIHSASGTIDCSGRDANITSADARLTLTGRCGQLHFIGDRITATISSATYVQVSGADNELDVAGMTAEAALIGNGGRFRFDKLGELRVNGDGMRIEADSITSIAAVGSRNEVAWASGTPVVNDLGNGNTLQPKP